MVDISNGRLQDEHIIDDKIFILINKEFPDYLIIVSL
jgi:hypothetical protein